MESPTLSLSLLLLPLGRNRLDPKALSLFSPFLFHYFHRVFVYPLRLHLLNCRRNTAFPNTAFGETADRKTAYGETADGFVDDRNTASWEASDRKTQYIETVDQVIEDRKTAFLNTADRKTAFGESADGFLDDRNTAFWKTQYSETVDRVTNDRKTAFENTVDRKTAFENTADQKTAFENTADQKTADPKTSYAETADKFIDDRKTADSENQYSETIDQVIDDRETTFQKITHRKTANRETTDRKTSYSETSDQFIDDQKTTDRKTASGFPASIAAMAFAYNIWNTYVQARWVSHYADFETDEWFWWRFCVGMAVFVTGMVINVWSDLVLLGLKGKGGEYKVPKGGLFEFVSCPNYFGEVVEWLGWAVMTWSWAGIGFFLFTCSNLVPRAHSHHKWYLEKFGEDYPKKRKAVIPFLY